MQSYRNAHTATLLAGGKVLIVGGGEDWQCHLDAEIYDVSSNTMASAGNAPARFCNHYATLLSDGSVLLSGSGSSMSQAALYFPDFGFKNLGLTPQNMYGVVSVKLNDGTVLMTGPSTSLLFKK